MTTKGLNIIRSKSNSITFYVSLGMRNQIETQKERSQGNSIQHNSMHYLPRGGLRTKVLNIIRSKFDSITFYWSLAMHNQIETQKERNQSTSVQYNSMHYLPRGGTDTKKIEDYPFQIKLCHFLWVPWDRQSNRNTKGTVPSHFNSAQVYALFAYRGDLNTKGLNIIRSKSNSITFYGSLGMRNQIETQNEPSQGTSTQDNSMHYLPRGGSQNKRFEHYSLQIQFYHVLWVTWDAQSTRNTKGTVPRHFNSAQFYALFAWRGSDTKRVEHYPLQILFCHFLWVPWDVQSNRNTKGTAPRHFNSEQFYALFA